MMLVFHFGVRCFLSLSSREILGEHKMEFPASLPKPMGNLLGRSSVLVLLDLFKAT